MGSRYGGLKQLDPVGPNGETIIDYSVYDAIEAGFSKAVFIIRRDIEDEFKSKPTGFIIKSISAVLSTVGLGILTYGILISI